MEDLSLINQKPNPPVGRTNEETFSFQNPRRRTRPVQSDFFRHLALFHAHFSPEPLRSQYSRFLPSYLRPGNLEKYLTETEKPQLFGNKFWWVDEGVPEPGFEESQNGECTRNDASTATPSNPKGNDVQMDRSNVMEVANSSEKEIQDLVYEGQRVFDDSQTSVCETIQSDLTKANNNLYSSSSSAAGASDHAVSNTMELEAMPERADVDSTQNNQMEVKADDGCDDQGAETIDNQVDLSVIESFLMSEFEDTRQELVNNENGDSAIPNHFAGHLNSEVTLEPSNDLSKKGLRATEEISIQDMGHENLQPNLKGDEAVSEVCLSGALEEGEIPERHMAVTHSSVVDIQDATAGKGNMGDGHVNGVFPKGKSLTSNKHQTGSMDYQVEAFKVGVKERDGGEKGDKLKVAGMKRAGKDKKDQSKDKKRRTVQVIGVPKKQENYATNSTCNGKPQRKSEKESGGCTVVKKVTDQLQQSQLRSHDFVQYSRDQLLQLRSVDVPEDIVQMRCFIEAELTGGHPKRKIGESVQLDDSRKKTKKDPMSVDKSAEEKVAKISTDKSITVNQKQEPNLDETSKKEAAKISTDITVDEKLEPKLDETSMKEVDDIPKKKKRGPASTERKAKKKIKERKKRAEKNRKLGVKRLKIQTIVKPKPVVHCRHYLMGRCHEGEKCKFSHDVVPLTKAKPCCFFAKQSCMKGDDCPFDHELSKYPCNNIVNSGSCSRGEGCLFSHKIKPEDAATTNSTSETDAKSSVPSTTHSNPKPQAYSVQSSLLNTAKFVKDLVGVVPPNKPTQVPKGMSFVSFTKDNSNQHKQPQPSQKLDSTADTSRMLNSSDMSTRTPPSYEAKPHSSSASDNLNYTLVGSQSTGNVRTENVKDHIGTSSNLKPPKGLSFVSYTNPKPDESSDTLQRIQSASNRMLNPGGGTPPTAPDGKLLSSASGVIKKTVQSPLDIIGSLSTGAESVECHVGSTSNSKTPKGLSFVSFGNPKPDVESTNHKQSSLPKKTVDGDGDKAVGSLSKTISTPQGTNPLSFSNNVLTSGDSMQARFPFLVNRGSTASSGDRDSIGNIKKLTALPFQLPASPASTSSKLDNILGKGATSSPGQRSLQSTLAFASKFNSGAGIDSISTSTASPVLDAGRSASMAKPSALSVHSNTNDSAGTSGSGVVQNSKQANKVAAIWEILYGGGSQT